MKGELHTKKFFNMLAFCAIVISGVVLVLTKVLSACGITWVGLGVLNTIAYFLSYIVLAISAFHYVRTKHSVVWTIIYIVAVLLVFVPLVINLF